MLDARFADASAFPTLGFNPVFVIDAMKALRCEDVSMSWKDAKSPAKFEEPGLTHVLMPVSIE